MENNRLPLFSIAIISSVLFGLINLLTFYLSLPKYNAQIYDLKWAEEEVYQIEFTRYTEEDEGKVALYRINSDGKELEFIKNIEAPKETEIREGTNNIVKKENVFLGQGKSPDNKQEIAIESTSLYNKLTLNGETISSAIFFPFIEEFWIQEVEWLPDNRHIIISTGLEVGTYDIKTKQFARLVSSEDLKSLQ